MESTGPKIRYLRNLNLIFSPTNIHIMRCMLAIIALMALFSSCQPDLVSQGKAPVSLSNIDLSQPLSVAMAKRVAHLISLGLLVFHLTLMGACCHHAFTLVGPKELQTKPYKPVPIEQIEPRLQKRIHRTALS